MTSAAAHRSKGLAAWQETAAEMLGFDVECRALVDRAPAVITLIIQVLL